VSAILSLPRLIRVLAGCTMKFLCLLVARQLQPLEKLTRFVDLFEYYNQVWYYIFQGLFDISPFLPNIHVSLVSPRCLHFFSVVGV